VIQVQEKPEYQHFDRDVRRPGRAFLATNPRPTNKEFRPHEYWSRSREQLREAYGRICAYTSFHLPTSGSLDHFIPKSLMPTLAYEWSNFRLCHDRVNNWKKSSLVAVDPFFLDSDWVYLSLPECIVRVANEVCPIVRSRLKQTLELLRINRDETFVDLRYNLVSDYVNGITDLEFLTKYYPFIGREVERQGGRLALEPLFVV
jgi:hypothetical protein